MSLHKEHIDLKRLQDYFNGKLSPEEMNTLEMEAQNDPFLYEAMEGYEAHPEGINRINNLQNELSGSNKSFFGKGTLTVLGIACVVYITAIFIKPNIEEDNSNKIAAIEEFEEVEIVPESIDTFEFAEIEDQITAQDIVDSKLLIEESNDELAEIFEDTNLEIINVEEEENEIENHEELIPESENYATNIYAPHIYQYDMYVIDYRSIERKNEVISYTRYEFTGLSAEYEDELAKETSYDRETKVDVPYIEYLEKSMYYFSRGHYKKALNRYLTIIEQYPRDLNAHFYGALCYYDMKQYPKALQFFTDMQKYENEQGFIAFRQEAKWYQAKTLLILKRKSEAIVILDEIIVEGLFYTKDAIQLKSSL